MMRYEASCLIVHNSGCVSLQGQS